MGFEDRPGHYYNPNKKGIRVGDLGEADADKEWKKYLRQTMGNKKAIEAAKNRREHKKIMEEHERDRLEFRGY